MMTMATIMMISMITTTILTLACYLGWRSGYGDGGGDIDPTIRRRAMDTVVRAVSHDRRVLAINTPTQRMRIIPQ